MALDKERIYGYAKAYLVAQMTLLSDKIKEEEELGKLIDYANEFHRADECGEIRR